MSARPAWQGMELRHLAALAAVVEEASFTAAGRRLGYGTSAVSGQIAQLERIVGSALVERSGRPRSVRPTAAGCALLVHIEPILAQLRLARREIDALGPARPVRFGISRIFGAWLPAALPGALMLQAEGRLAHAPCAALLDAVAAERLDAAFVERNEVAGGLHSAELLRDPCVLVAPAGSGATAEQVLERLRLVVLPGCAASRELLDHAGAGHAADSPASALALVRAGAGAAVLARRDVPRPEPALAVHSLPGLPERVLALAWRPADDDRPAIAALLAAARAALAA